MSRPEATKIGEATRLENVRPHSGLTGSTPVDGVSGPQVEVAKTPSLQEGDTGFESSVVHLRRGHELSANSGRSERPAVGLYRFESCVPYVPPLSMSGLDSLLRCSRFGGLTVQIRLAAYRPTRSAMLVLSGLITTINRADSLKVRFHRHQMEMMVQVHLRA
jgi:hypothetical protein